MKKIKSIFLGGIIIISFTSCRNLPKDKLEFINTQTDVTDSLNTLRDLKCFILKGAEVTNCYLSYHNKLTINNIEIGDFDELVNGTKVDEEIVKKVYSGDIYRLISIMAYLKKNHINGFYIDYSYHFFVFLYREYEYGDRSTDSRSILFKDEFIGEIKNKFIIKDESKGLILAIYNLPPPK